MQCGTSFALLVGLATLVACGDDDEPRPAPGEPRLEVEYPSRGAFVQATADGEVVVQGRVLHLSGLVALRVNDEPATLGAGGAFHCALTPALGINEVHVVAERASGEPLEVRQAFLYGEFGPEPDPTLHAHVGPELVAYAGTVAVDLLAAGLEDGTLIHGVTFRDIPQCDSLTIHSVKARGVEAGVVPQSGRLKLSGVLDTSPYSRLDVDFTARGCTLLGLDVDGNMTAASADLLAELRLRGEDRIGVEVTGVSVELHDYDVDLDRDLLGVLGEVVQYLTEDAVVEAVRDALVEQVAPLVAEQLDALLGRHELATIDTTAGPAALVAEVALGGAGDAPALLVTPAGLELRAGMDVSVEAAGTSGTLEPVHEGPGPWYVPAGAPPPPGTGELVVSVSQASVSSLLYQLWRMGLLDTSLDVTGIVQLLGGPWASMQEIRADLEATLPVVVTARPASPGEILLQAGDLILRVYDGVELEAAIAVNAELTVRAVRIQNSAALTIGLVVEDVKLTSSALETPAGSEAVRSLMDALAVLAPPLIASQLESNVTVRIPTPAAIPLDGFEARIENGLLSVIAAPGPDPRTAAAP